MELFSPPQNGEFFKSQMGNKFIFSKNSPRDALESIQDLFPNPMYPNQNVHNFNEVLSFASTRKSNFADAQPCWFGKRRRVGAIPIGRKTLPAQKPLSPLFFRLACIREPVPDQSGKSLLHLAQFRWTGKSRSQRFHGLQRFRIQSPATGRSADKLVVQQKSAIRLGANR